MEIHNYVVLLDGIYLKLFNNWSPIVKVKHGFTQIIVCIYTSQFEILHTN